MYLPFLKIIGNILAIFCTFYACYPLFDMNSGDIGVCNAILKRLFSHNLRWALGPYLPIPSPWVLEISRFANQFKTDYFLITSDGHLFPISSPVHTVLLKSTLNRNAQKQSRDMTRNEHWEHETRNGTSRLEFQEALMCLVTS